MSGTTPIRLTLLALLAALPLPARAINKCIAADGRVTYTDASCAVDSRATRIELLPPPPRADQAAAQARGEQALVDARVLDARIDAAAAARRRREEAARQAEEEEARRQRVLQDSAAAGWEVIQVPRYRSPPRPNHPLMSRPAPAPQSPLMGNYPFTR